MISREEYAAREAAAAAARFAGHVIHRRGVRDGFGGWTLHGDEGRPVDVLLAPLRLVVVGPGVPAVVWIALPSEGRALLARIARSSLPPVAPLDGRDGAFTFNLEVARSDALEAARQRDREIDGPRDADPVMGAAAALGRAAADGEENAARAAAKRIPRRYFPGIAGRGPGVVLAPRVYLAHAILRRLQTVRRLERSAPLLVG